jgi:four helix bundle protein
MEQRAGGARMGAPGGYQNLKVWQKAMDLAEAIFNLTQGWPAVERYRLTDQILRAAVSVPSNIAEGQGRTGPKELLHHLSIANGSLHEVETHLLLARRFGYLDDEQLSEPIALAREVGRLLGGLKRSLRSDHPPPHHP